MNKLYAELKTQKSFFSLILYSLYIGTFGYGGPAMIAMIKQLIVNKKKYINEKEFVDGLGLAQLLPGATGVNLIAYIGYKNNNFWGIFLISIAFVIPSFITINILSWAYFTYGELGFVKSLFLGLGALVVALLVNAIYMISSSLFDYKNIKGVLTSFKELTIIVLSFIGLFVFHSNIFWIILLCGLTGIVFFYLVPLEFKVDMHGTKLRDFLHQSEEENEKKSFIYYFPIIFMTLLLFAVISYDHTAVNLIIQFLKLGSITFGGGFVAIPLIKGIVVDQYQWLTLEQFRDGIALGQITPGPVLITAAFIGYKLGGVFGSFISTVSIFVPSLLGVVVLSKIHNRIEQLAWVKAMMRGFLAGFVGLLISVTIQFGINSFISIQAIAIFIFSLIYLFYFRKPVIWLILIIAAVSIFLF